jgi:hypothetical protein
LPICVGLRYWHSADECQVEAPEEEWRSMRTVRFLLDSRMEDRGLLTSKVCNERGYKL